MRADTAETGAPRAAQGALFSERSRPLRHARSIGSVSPTTSHPLSSPCPNVRTNCGAMLRMAPGTEQRGVGCQHLTPGIPQRFMARAYRTKRNGRTVATIRATDRDREARIRPSRGCSRQFCRRKPSCRPTKRGCSSLRFGGSRRQPGYSEFSQRARDPPTPIRPTFMVTRAGV